MVSDTTFEVVWKNTVTMKSTGHDKYRVSACLTARVDGTKAVVSIMG